MIDRIATACPWLSCFLLGLIASCSSPQAPVAGPGVAEERSQDLPRGAVEVGDQLYQVPIGEDEDGCPIYRMYSPTKLVAQVISYRDLRGDFTTDRQEADCTTEPD
jgi:hypothetical protein